MRRAMIFSVVIWCASPAAVTAGCGDDDSGDGSPCTELAQSICELACACSSDCRIRFPSGGTQGFGNEIESPTEQCNRAFTNSCNDPGIDVEACTDALPTAECLEDGPAPALDLPEECAPE